MKARQVSDPGGFWDKRAETFPRYSGDEGSYEVRLLRLAKTGGAVFKNKRILDVGCGSGLFSIGLALEAAELTALDISSKMMEILRLEADRRELRNITYVQGDWLEFEASSQNARRRLNPGAAKAPEADVRQSGQLLKGGFDLIFCSMNPVFRDEAARERLKLFAPVQVVYIGWAAPMLSDVATGLYEKYAINPVPMVDAPIVKQWLGLNGLKYSSYPLSGDWDVSFSLEQLKYNSINTLDNYGITPDRGWLGDYLKQFRQADGSYMEKTAYQVEMLIFDL